MKKYLENLEKLIEENKALTNRSAHLEISLNALNTAREYALYHQQTTGIAATPTPESK